MNSGERMTFVVGLVSSLDDFRRLRSMCEERGFRIGCEGSLLAGYCLLVSEDALNDFALMAEECDVSGFVKLLRVPKRRDLP